MRSFTYHFDSGGETHSYTHTIGAEIDEASLPGWTRLDFQDCSGCRKLGLNYCLAAAHLVEPAELLNHFVSHEEITVTVQAPERTYSKKTTVQEGLSGLFGLVMATSGCPTFDFLKGIGHFHLPLASFEETLFRSLSAYFMVNYLSDKQPNHAEVVADIKHLYDRVKETNLAVSSRMRKGLEQKSDASMNALVILDSFGALVPMSVEDGLSALRKQFLS